MRSCCTLSQHVRVNLRFLEDVNYHLPTLDILFRQITTFINVCVAFVFGLLTLSLVDFTKIFQFKGFKPKNKGQTNFYECCDLTKKVYPMINILLHTPIHFCISEY